MQRVGVVRELRRFPVKSMAAESLESAEVSWHGFAGDRRWAFVRPGMERSGFPWLTIRENAELWRYAPRFVDPDAVESSVVMVRTPAGDELDVADPQLARQLGDGVRVTKQYGGIFDTFPISVLTVQSVAVLAGLIGQDLAGRELLPLRFRPNILIDAVGAEPFPEDRWEGAILQIGELRCRLDKRDKRCAIVNVDPSDGTSNPAVLRAIARERDAHFGMYGTTVQPGRITLGDAVFLER